MPPPYPVKDAPNSSQKSMLRTIERAPASVTEWASTKPSRVRRSLMAAGSRVEMVHRCWSSNRAGAHEMMSGSVVGGPQFMSGVPLRPHLRSPSSPPHTTSAAAPRSGFTSCAGAVVFPRTATANSGCFVATDDAHSCALRLASNPGEGTSEGWAPEKVTVGDGHCEAFPPSVGSSPTESRPMSSAPLSSPSPAAREGVHHGPMRRADAETMSPRHTSSTWRPATSGGP
eukprot:scaffold253305_cov27-Tisochrysis_lutea.AAC.3